MTKRTTPPAARHLDKHSWEVGFNDGYDAVLAHLRKLAKKTRKQA